MSLCVCVTRETQASAVEDEGICEAVAGGFQGYNSTFNQLKMILYASILWKKKKKTLENYKSFIFRNKYFRIFTLECDFSELEPILI